jgi:peptide/nickel transport system permease protein
VGLSSWLVRRIAGVVFVLWAVTTLVFFLTRVTGDPAAVVAGPSATHAQLLAIRHQLGLDKPVLTQYVDFLVNAVHFNFGTSFQTNERAMSAVEHRLGASAVLAGTAAVLSLVIAIPAGIAASVRRGRPTASIVQAGALVGQSVPSFVLGIVLILVFAVWLHLLPSIGFAGASSLILPAFTLAAFLAARQTRLVATYMTEELSSNYVRTARAHGFGEARIRYLHALRNALIPIVAVFGLDVAEFFAGAIVTETVFAWPGVGQLIVQAVTTRDYPVLEAAVFVIAVIVVAVNLAVDLSYHLIDPRVRGAV